MIKSAIINTLVLSSTLAFSVQNTKNIDVQEPGENSASDAKFNNMNCEPRRLNVQLFSGLKWTRHIGTFLPRAIKCYNELKFKTFKMGSVKPNSYYLMYFSEADCQGKCAQVFRMVEKQFIVDVSPVGRYALSYKWGTL